MQPKKKALGRGLSALLESPETDITTRDVTGDFVMGAIAQVMIEHIEPNPFQPRTHFSEEELADLAISIQEQGIIQPITVRKMGHDRYQLISGERRLKASKVAGLTEIPAYIRVANDEQMLEMALVENIQRQDLNPIEIALSFQRLLEECSIRQEDLSHKVGKDRSTISNYIRLLRLPVEIQAAIRDNRITMGHARSLITINEPALQVAILRQILDKQLSVRQVEDMVRTAGSSKASVKNLKKMALPEKFESVKSELRQKFQVPVELKVKPNGSGQITFSFRSEEDFQKIITSFDI
jgi:ParB family transcriptional regulator, chromosome partitioning protein